MLQTENRNVTLPPPVKISAVVKDVDKTIEFLSSLGLGPWQDFQYSPRDDEVMIGEPFSLKCSSTNLGPIVLELNQPLEERSFWARLLEAKGEGQFIVAFNVSNYDEIVAKLREQGNTVVVEALFEGKRWCYLDTKPGGIIFELLDNFDL